MENLRLGEFFCGPGGLALGALQAGKEHPQYQIQHAWANDIDSSSCQTYRANIARSDNCESVICGDVHEVVRDLANLSDIDIFAYGFPCNDFSIVGLQKGMDGDFGGLYKTGISVLNHFKPRVLVAENVGGINSANDGNAFQKILRELQSAGNGYELTVHLYKSEEYGIPQTRHRYIIVGFDTALGLRFKVPEPTHLVDPVPVRDVLENMPSDLPNNEFTNMADHVVERLKYIKPGENAWTADLPEDLRLNVKGAKLSQIYKRLDPDKPSYTITGSGGGGTHGYHYDEPRALTNRERARIQTFPDDFVFHGKKEEIRKQIGMAVPPMLSKVIFTAILNTLAGIGYAHIPANFHFDGYTQQKLF